MARFTDKVAVVTGGAGGIGSAVVHALARDGAAVVVADLDEPAAQRVAQAVRGNGGQACSARVDLRHEADIVALVETTVARWGGIDILDNNAALTSADVLARDTTVTDMDVAVWDEMLAVNLRSQLLMCKHVIPHMLTRGGGAIVNMSSGAANAGDLIRTAYSVSKSAIATFTKYVATQYGQRGIRANTIVPGLILTDAVRAQIPPAMLAAYSRSLLTTFVGEPEDVADLVCFLVSPQARYITGQSISLDGGMSAHSARLSGQT